MNFADTLKQLPPVSHLAGLQLLDGEGRLIASIENQPGKAGSLAVYAALATRHGGRIDAVASEEGLRLFAEHTASARAHPGTHPNIDRLFALIDSGAVLQVRLLPREDATD